MKNLNYRFTVYYDETAENKIKQIINHELGHSLYFDYLSKNNTNEQLVKNVYNNYIKKANKEYTKENISKYALKNHHEFFAECYSMYCNENERKKLNKNIINMIEEVVK